MRITGISIDNYKCVRHGYLNLGDGGMPDVTALVGENGSGKTALVESLEIFKGLFSGPGVPAWVAGSIPADADSCKMVYELESSEDSAGSRRYEYKVELAAKCAAEGEAEFLPRLYGVLCSDCFRPEFQVRVLSETLSIINTKNGDRRTLFTTAGTQLVEPAEVRESVGSGGKGDKHWCFNEFMDSEARLRLFKARTYEESRSMLYEGICAEWEDYAPVLEGQKVVELRAAVSDIAKFARYGLYAAGAWEAAAIESGRLPLYYDRLVLPPFGRRLGKNYEFDAFVMANVTEQGAFYISTDPEHPAYVPIEFLGAISETVRNVSAWLANLMPGFELSLKTEFGPEELIDGDWLSKGRGVLRWQWMHIEPIDTEAGCRRVALIASRGGLQHSLSCESTHIQRLVSLAWLLIASHGRAGFTAVIDGLGEGIHLRR